MTTIARAPSPEIAQTFAALEHRLPVNEYNYEHFRTRHLLYDAAGTLDRRGIPPGECAPEFELARAGGGSLRLSDLRDQPTLLHFGSWT